MADTPAPPLEDSDQPQTLAIAREELEVTKRTVETGVVRVKKVVHEEEQVVRETLKRVEVDVQRIPLNRLVGQPMEPRYEGDTLVVPVLEEVYVKRWLLKEELRIRRSEVEVPYEERVVTRREEAVVERIKR